MHGYKVAKARSWLAAAVALITLSAGCAAESDGSGGSDEGDVLGDTIKVGGLVTKTSPVGYTTAEAEVGAAARFARANAEGGVDGRTIDFIGAEDDTMTAAAADAAVKKLVQREEVFAIVPWVAFGAGTSPVAEDAGVTRFGWGVSRGWCTSKLSYGVSGCLQPEDTEDEDLLWSRGYTQHQIADVLGGKDGRADGQSVWIQGIDNSDSSNGVRQADELWAAAGYEVAGASASVPAAAPPQDWLPYLNKIMKSDGGGPPDVVFSIMSGATNLGLYGALRKAGYEGIIVDATSYDPRLLADPQGAQVMEGVYTGVSFAPFEADIPEVEQMMDDVRKEEPEHVFTQATAMGYWAADMFLTALEEAGKDVTAERYRAALDKLQYENPAVGKLSFPRSRTEPSPCSALVQVRQGEFVEAQPLECFEK
ncbi:ABC transporter substrate-binding protein [Streptomyces sp. WMMC500]|uniref:ABC transporter substrate-binding protein n=1 Tax=Streptomyces sp. WMMC500 TaxID=3015154 RepID=UPI00248ABCF2|nr:ABC transporter substrate-binding protein [Streptomyces sp. WMMC500]WBB61276.1 ABC transporter substrate-binding protein [Streptomyces sp. WMMC500]